MRKAKDGQAIQDHILKKKSKYVYFVTGASLVFITLSFIIEFNISFRMYIYDCIKGICEFYGEWTYELAREFKILFANSLEMLANVTLTYLTIMMAVVIFFCEIQESRRFGVSHRRIMSYSVGTFLLPVLLFFSAIEIPIIYVTTIMSWKVAAFMNIVYTYIIQTGCIYVCLYISSHLYVRQAICNVEIRTFEYISNENKLYNENELDEESLKDNREIWAYLMRHLEQVFKSDETIDDKMVLAQKLMRTPFFEKEGKFKDLVFQPQKLCTLEAENIYEFYYNNVLGVFNELETEQKSEDRLKFLVLIYDFVEEMNEQYHKTSEWIENENVDNVNRKNRLMVNYVITISAILNSILASQVKESQAAANKVLQICFDSMSEEKDIERKTELEGLMFIQLRLFFLYQELLFVTNKGAIKETNLEKSADLYVEIERLCTRDKIEVRFPYEYSWWIWCKYGCDLPLRKCVEYLNRALATFKGGRAESQTIGYIIHKIRARGGIGYDNTTSSISK